LVEPLTLNITQQQQQQQQQQPYSTLTTCVLAYLTQVPLYGAALLAVALSSGTCISSGGGNSFLPTKGEAPTSMEESTPLTAGVDA